RREFLFQTADGRPERSPARWLGEVYKRQLDAYRKDNNLKSFPNIEEKLGPMKEDILNSPVSYLSFLHNNWRWTFQDVPGSLIHLNNPSIIILSDFQAGGYYGSHPDYLPPDPRLGTTDDFKKLFESLHTQDHFVVPTAIPAWWDENSPTIQSLAGSFEEIAQIDVNGQPFSQTVYEKNGYYVSPYHAVVQQKMTDIIEDLTLTVPGDMIFMDEVTYTDFGRIKYDFNPSSPSPAHYHEGWRQQINNRQDSRIVVKSGYDRLTEYAVGFLGTVLSSVVGFDSPFPHNLEKGQWEYYPSAPILYGDKVLFYQTSDQPTFSKSALSWNLTHGVMLNWQEKGGGEGNDDNIKWLPVISDFQKYVLSAYVQNRITNYSRLSDGVTTCNYGDTKVITNWSETESYDYGGHAVSSDGVVVENSRLGLIAGIFNKFSGENLAGGNQYLIVTAEQNEIVIRHPMGSNTPIKITRPSVWSDDSMIRVYATTSSDLHEINANIDGESIHFNLDNFISNETVLYYKVIYGITGIQIETDEGVPKHFYLYENYPNPFNPSTKLKYDLPVDCHINIRIFN
ncbi:hypothetical protein BVY01_00610, partial [bacterium I07]